MTYWCNCNLSFKIGTFPNKTAILTPLYKPGDRHQFINYRPVSLLAQFPKISEKLLISRRENLIDKHN